MTIYSVVSLDRCDTCVNSINVMRKMANDDPRSD